MPCVLLPIFFLNETQVISILGLFLLGIIAKRTTNLAAITSLVIGILTIFWLTFSPKWTGILEAFKSPFHGFMTSVIGTLVILLVGFIVTGFTKKRNTSTQPINSSEDPDAPATGRLTLLYKLTPSTPFLNTQR